MQKLAKFGYEQTMQTGSHIRITKDNGDSQHHITIPAHNPIKVGTLNSILTEIATHLKIDKDALIKAL